MATKNATRSAWYAGVLLFRSEVGGVTSLRPLCEERLVLFRGGSAKQVERAARRYARREQHAYENAAGETVDWQFESLERIDLLDDPPDNDGWEVFSRFTRRSLKALRRGKEDRLRVGV
jgi:hypothetical protein